jgi:hypothetical protein
MDKRNKTKGQTMIYQNIAHKTKDRATRTPLKTGVNPGAHEWYTVLAQLVAPVVLL